MQSWKNHTTCTDIPILLLYNLDETWDPPDIENTVSEVDILEKAMQGLGHPFATVPLITPDWNRSALQAYSPDEYIVFNWSQGLPGIPRSYSHVARILEDLDFAYTGASPEALELGEYKTKMKVLFEKQGIPTPRWKVFSNARRDGWDCFPAIVKVAWEHASLGIAPESVVTTPRELYRRIEYVLDTFHQPALVEDFIDGREFPIWLWGNQPVEVMPLVEWDFSAFNDLHERLWTYQDKASPGSSQLIEHLPARLGGVDYQTIEQIAIAAHRALGCRDYGRVDIRLRDGVFYVLDVNSNPDISAGNSLFYSAGLAGYDYGQVCSRLVNLAYRRSLRRSGRNSKYPHAGQSGSLAK